MEQPVIVQLRGTIFFPQFIGYTQENADKFKELLLPDAEVMGLPPTGVPFNKTNPLALAYGMPWQLISNGIRILFLPNKIDILQEREGAMGEVDVDFLKICTELFLRFKEASGFSVNRLAYAPLLSIKTDGNLQNSEFWQGIIKQISYRGVPLQNIEFNYLLKNVVNIHGKDIEMNFLHQISDGYHYTRGAKDYDCVLLRLDINTVPDKPYSFEIEDIKLFYTEVLRLQKEQIENLFV